jgi:hypothetical protein
MFFVLLGISREIEEIYQNTCCFVEQDGCTSFMPLEVDVIMGQIKLTNFTFSRVYNTSECMDTLCSQALLTFNCTIA